MSIDRLSYQKGFEDCLNYIIYKIFPRVKNKEDLKRELEKLEATIKELTAEEIQKMLMLP